MQKKKILVAALNWGLGHATRCIPIINALHLNGFEPVIASDGQALDLLKKEFPHSTHLELPSYSVQYSKKGKYLKWKMILDSPRIVRAIQKEKIITKKIIESYNIQGIISDSRLGVRSKKLKKNVFITHQLNVLSGNTTYLSSYLHQQYINKFGQCWVPDAQGEKNLSGVLGHLREKPENVTYIGPISRLEKRQIPEVYHYLVLLSGPEPQRSILESILLKELETAEVRILFVRGIISDESLNSPNTNIQIKNYLYGKSLQEAINCSKYIISRPGYTNLMDLAKLEKKAFFIPTPGQTEQEYLAKRLEKLRISPFCKQEAFDLSQLQKIEEYKGLSDFGNHVVFRDLFSFFESE